MFRWLAIVGLSILFSIPAGAASRNPIISLPVSVRSVFACIMWHESRSTFNHMNLGDNNRYGSSGIFQIEQTTWARWAAPLGIKVPVWRATPYEQELVAVNIWRHDGFGPWSNDGCV